MIRYLWVFLGAGLGGVARGLVVTAVSNRFALNFPLGTVLVNLSGCFAIGLVMGVLSTRADAPAFWRMLLVVGFLGGYTTFSSFAYETLTAEKGGLRWTALLNVALSVGGGYLAAWAGTWLAGRR